MVDLMQYPEEFLKLVFKAGTDGNWALVAALVLIGAVALTKKYAAKYAPRFPWLGWLSTKWGGVALMVAGAFAGALGNMLFAGGAMTWALLGSTLKVTFYALVPTLLRTLLGIAAVNTDAMKAEAEKAGLEAVKAKPGKGVEGVIGKAKDVR